jgi:hypothetical protein
LPGSSDAAPAAGRTRVGRWWHRTKWTIRLLVGIPLLLLTVVLLLMRSPLVGRVVASQVRQLTGGEWHADHAAITLNGQLIVSELELRVPGVAGPAGELLAAKQAVIDVDWWQLPPMKWVTSGAAAPVVRAVRLSNPVFRLSQSTDDGTLNIGQLTPPPSTGGKVELPRIDVIDGRMEFTEHSPVTGRFDQLAVIPIAGALMPAEDGRASFTVRLQEIGRTPAVSGERRGMVLDGRVDLTGGEASVKLLNISLDAWPAESVPSRFRDLWRRLAVQGEVRQALFAYSQHAGLDVSVSLVKVALAVPVPAERPGDDDGFLSLHNVDGTIGLSNAGLSADLTGMIEQQPGRSEVKLRTRGLDVSSGFRCEITGRDLSVTEQPQFLPYVPATVRQYLNWFGGPTAIVDAKVVIARGDPVNGVAAPVTVPEGRMMMRNGRAAFHKFPYPFHDLTGEVTFDDTTIRIVRITGVGPKGSPLTASALITPLTEGAQADVKVDVKDVPVDEELLSVMQPSYRRLMEVLFAREKYEELLKDGLVRPPAAEGAGRSETAPDGREFAFGGVGDVHVHLQRPLGVDVEWSTKIGVNFAKAGLVPEPFAFPIVARDLSIEINDDMAELKSGRFSGLHGGTAEVEAKIHFASSATGEVEPDVRISARDVPVDDLLLSAVPGPDPAEGGDPNGPMNAKEILRRLDIRGVVDCGVKLSAAKETPVPTELVGPLGLPPVDYQVDVQLGNVTAAPVGVLGVGADGAEGGLCIRELAGSLVVTQSGVRIDGLRAGLGRVPAGAARSDSYAATTPAGEITLAMEAESLSASSADQGRLHAELGLKELDLTDPFGPAVRVFSQEAADFLASARATRHPTGVVDARVTLDSERGRPGTPVRIGVRVLRASGLSLRALGGEVMLEEPLGTVTVTTRDRVNPTNSEGETLRFDGMTGKLSFNGSPAGSFAVDGAFVRDPVSGGVSRGLDLACDLDGWKFEGGLTQAIIAEFGGESVSEGYQGLAPQGEFDAEVRLSDRGETGMLSGWVEPRSLQIVRRGQPIDFLRIGGRVNFRGEQVGGEDAVGLGSLKAVSGSIDDASAVTEEWSAIGGATWRYTPSSGDDRGGVSIDAHFEGEVRDVGPGIRAMLPETASRTLDDLSLSFAEPVVIRGGRLTAMLRDAKEGSGDRFGFDGTVLFAGLSGDLGVPMSDAIGRLTIHVGGGSEGDAAAAASEGAGEALSLRLEGPLVRLAGVPLSDYVIDAARTGPGELVLRDATASCHGGKVFARGSASWTPDAALPPGTEPPVTLRLSTLIAGVNFAPLLDDLSAAGVGGVAEPGSDGKGTPPRLLVSSSDMSRGTVDARIAIESIQGEPESKFGRGAIRIANGDVLRLPLIMPLMQVSNLQLPWSDRLDYLQATFYVRGRRAVFDDVSLLSDSIAIVGGGSITMPNMDLDMRFNTKANRRIPLWSNFFEAVRDEIASTTVTGTIEKPVVRSEPLTGTRRMLGDIVAPGQSTWRQDQAETARRERERLRGE